jgi:hypothetical protein
MRRDRGVDADGHAAVDLFAHGAEELAEGFAAGAQLGVEQGRLDRGLRHVVAVDRME